MSSQLSALRIALANDYRVNSLLKTKLLDSPREWKFDCIIENISRKLDVPIAAMTLVEPHRQFFKSQTGIDANETDIKYSLCQYVVCKAGPVMIEDADQSDFSDHPAILELGIKSYLGVPLYFEKSIIGTLCVADNKPRRWGQGETTFLQNQATMIRFELFMRDKSTQH